MDILTATRTFLKRNPASKRKELLPYVMKKTGKGKSVICDEFSSLELQHKIYREKGRYWLEKPSGEKPSEAKFSIDYSKALRNIANSNINGDPGEALDSLDHLIIMLPKPQKEKLLPKLNEAYGQLNIVKASDWYSTQVKKLHVAKGLVRKLLSDVSEVLYEMGNC
jgi:hypothetical protein